MNSIVRMAPVLAIVGLIGCGGSSGPSEPGGSGSAADGGASGTNGNTPGSSGGAATGQGMTIAGDIMVPADFSGEAAKIIFGYGDKQILDQSGKLDNIPEKFLPSLAGIANPKITPGQPYHLEIDGADIPPGDHYVLVALYVKGTSGTIPQKDKDYVAGSFTAIHFAGASTTMPQMAFQKSQGQ